MPTNMLNVKLEKLRVISDETDRYLLSKNNVSTLPINGNAVSNSFYLLTSEVGISWSLFTSY